MRAKVLLGDIANFSNGKKSPKRIEDASIPVYGANGIIGYSDKFNANENTIIIGRVGSYCGSVYFSKNKSWITDNAIKCEAKQKNISRFIYYALLNLDLNRHRVGSGQPLLNQGILKNLEINKFNQDEQKKIAHILSTLDEKIELNRKMNATLEAMAQAIFKSWFVDFDPVHAKAQEKSEAELETAAAELGISREILDLFPSAFVESEMGMIPAGWEVKPLIELIDIVGGGTPKRSVDEFWDGSVPWFSVKDTPRVGDIFVIDTVEKITELGLSKSSAKLLPAGTTIITARGTVGNLALTAMPTSINQSCYGIKGKKISELYTYFLMSSVVNDLKKNVHGAVFDTITTNTFSTICVVVPSEDLHKRFDRTVLPLLERIKSNLYEITALQKTRDTLLPKLLSGELDMSEVEI